MVEFKEQIVMLPFMAQGHLIPFLSLARKLQEKSTNFTITIATTPLNVKYLKNSTNHQTTPPPQQIQFQALPFNGADYGLPPNVENTESLPLSKMVNLLQSTVSLKNPFHNFIAELVTQNGHPPICIISDLFMGWANDVAKSFGTKNVTFTTGGAYGSAAYLSIWQHLPHRLASEDEFFKVPGFPDSCRFHISQLHPFVRDADGTDSWTQFFLSQFSNSLNSFGMLCNTVEEIEPFGLDILRKYVKVPVWCVGPLLPSRMLITSTTDQISTHSRVLIGKHSGRDPGLSTDKCLDWLDSHSECSVLYISFGSQNSISPSQMMALALGLQESKKPFIWCIRPPIGFVSKEGGGEFNPEWLPNMFEETVRKENQGLLVYNWAPQLEILCHKSISAFLSHCGWNSVMESLSQGVPIIGWPLAGEQSYNSKMLMEEMGVAMELTRGTERCLEKDDVKKVLDIVMDNNSNNNKEGKGKEMKRKAVEIGELIRGSIKDEGSSLKSLDNFFSAVLSTKNN